MGDKQIHYPVTSNSVTQTITYKLGQIVGGGIAPWGLILIWISEKKEEQVFLDHISKEFLGRNQIGKISSKLKQHVPIHEKAIFSASLDSQWGTYYNTF